MYQQPKECTPGVDLVLEKAIPSLKGFSPDTQFHLYPCGVWTKIPPESQRADLSAARRTEPY